MAESEEALKNLLMRMKEKSEKLGLQGNIKKAKIMAIWFHHFMANRSGKYRSSDRFYLGGSKMTEDNDYSNEIQRHMLLGRKAMMNIDSMLKSKDHFTDKGPYIQSYV